MGRKIAIMSAHGSTLLALISLPLSFGIMGTAGLTSGWMLGMVAAMLLISCPLGWVMGFLWNSLLGLVLLPCVYLGQRLIAEPVRRDTTGWIGGSAVAIVGSAGGFLQLGSIRASTAALSAGIVWMLVIQIVGGALGIAAAQAGGYLGSMSALRRRRRRPEETGTVRFTVWRLMAITAILSALLSLLRLAGEYAVPLILSILVSSLIAWAIHRPVAWATNRWLDWRLKKRKAKRTKARLTRPATQAAAAS